MSLLFPAQTRSWHQPIMPASINHQVPVESNFLSRSLQVKNLHSQVAMETMQKCNEMKQRKAQKCSSQTPVKTGRWTKEEHAIFLEGLKHYGKDWKKLAVMIKSRTVVQIRTHAQKYFQKAKKLGDFQIPLHSTSMMTMPLVMSNVMVPCSSVASTAAPISSFENGSLSLNPTVVTTTQDPSLGRSAVKRKFDTIETTDDPNLTNSKFKSRRCDSTSNSAVTQVAEPVLSVDTKPASLSAPSTFYSQSKPAPSFLVADSPTGVDAIPFRFPISSIDFLPCSAVNLFNEDDDLQLGSLFGESVTSWLGSDAQDKQTSSAEPLNNMLIKEFLDEWDFHTPNDNSAAGSPASSPAPSDLFEFGIGPQFF
jgi:SHAQKYF class myb-like DNA-binding protein